MATESEALKSALDLLGITPGTLRLNNVVTNLNDSEAIDELRELIKSDFGRLGLKEKVELTPAGVIRARSILYARFLDKKNDELYPDINLNWAKVERTLKANPEALAVVLKAEEAGHQPGICFTDEKGFIIATLAPETPESARNCLYDEAVLQAEQMGWTLQTEETATHIAEYTEAYGEKGFTIFKTNKDLRDQGKVLMGSRMNKEISRFNREDAYVADDISGWRGELRVNFVD